MKKIVVLLFFMVAAVGARCQTMYICKGQSCTAVPATDAGLMKYSNNGTELTIAGVTYLVGEIDSIVFTQPSFYTSAKSDTVYVAYNGTSASVTGGNSLVQASIDGAHVTLTSSATDKELTYMLSGQSDDGALVLNGSYKLTLVLNGLSLTNPSGAAMDIECGKRIALVLADGTANALADATGGTQKSCFYTKGHVEVEGGGTLSLSGNTNHALFAKEYVELKSTTGSVTVTKAVGDGIHCGEYFEMKGGILSVSHIGGDGIDPDDLGNVLMKGGSIVLNIDSADAKGIKCDSTFLLSGGSVTGTVSGNAAKGVKALLLDVTGGCINLNVTGDPVVEDYEASYCTGVKADSIIHVSGGEINLTCSGTANRGISADYKGLFTGGNCTITNSSTAGTYNTSASATDTYSGKCIDSDGNVVITGGTYTLKSTGTAGKCLTCDGALTVGENAGTDFSVLSLTPVISCATTGSGYGSTGGMSQAYQIAAFGPGGGGNPGGGGGGGGNPGGGGGETSSASNAKAIKAKGAIVINNGSISCSAETDGAEGIESKSSITVNNGQIVVNCYDDCINSAGKLEFNGGFSYAYSTGNDAIDSNAGTSGSITINGGAVVGISTKGAPEEGLDADNAATVVTGGYVFSAGGTQSQSMSASATQPAAFLKNISLSSNYITLACGNTNLYTVKLPQAISGDYSFVSAPGMTTGSTCTLYRGTVAPTDSAKAFNDCFWTSPVVTTAATVKSWSQSSNYVQQ